MMWEAMLAALALLLLFSFENAAGTEPPDEELQSLAANGRLSDPETLPRQVDRLLADPRCGDFWTNFVTKCRTDFIAKFWAHILPKHWAHIFSK